jgi:hypothetical protein
MGYYIKNFDRTNEKTIELIKLWWGEKTGEGLGTMALTDYGFMVFNESHRPIAALFAYPVIGGSLALLGFPIANPNVFRDERREALGALATAAESAMRKLNYSYVVSYAGTKGAKELFSRLEWFNAETQVELFVKDLRKA